jgi:hypothetical protein
MPTVEQKHENSATNNKHILSLACLGDANINEEFGEDARDRA